MVGVLMLLVGFFLPGRIVISRSIPVHASAETVFDQLNTKENWKNWSALHKDKKLITRNMNPAKGAGVVSSIPNEVIISTIDLDSGMAGRLTWNLVQKDQIVLVKSRVEVEFGINPVARYRGLLLDRSLSSAFEQDLGRLKKYCENLNSNI